MARPRSTDQFLGAIRDAGGSLSNAALRFRLGWEEDKYEKIKIELCEDGQILRGKGKGGTVSLVTATAQFENSSEFTMNTEIEESITRELDLYEPMQIVLQRDWKKRTALYEFHVERTAHLGKRDTGGSWSRPDLVVVGTKKYEFLKDRLFELHTFEIKPHTDVTIKGVLEALAHRESATRSYVAYHTNGNEFTTFREHSRITQLAARHGVGVIAVKRPDDFSAWTEIVPAQRANPDLDSLESFIKDALSPEAKSKIHMWF